VLSGIPVRDWPEAIPNQFARIRKAKVSNSLLRLGDKILVLFFIYRVNYNPKIFKLKEKLAPDFFRIKVNFIE